MQLDQQHINILAQIAGRRSFVKSVEIGDTIKIETSRAHNYEDIAKLLMPWRKGPFAIDDLFIDSEWRSNIKYNLIAPALDIEDKKVLDLGCNNGYYLFRMLEKNPKRLIGFEPNSRYYTQFAFLNSFIKAPINVLLKDSSNLDEYQSAFDTIVCLGVLYHRSDPIGTLRAIAASLKRGGDLYVDSLIVGDGSDNLNDNLVFFPDSSYAKMPNVWFIPSIPVLCSWLERTGFKDIETIAVKPTDQDEQRKTEWITGESLDDFLDPNDQNLTVEGFPAPVRAYIRAKRK